jgi:hypothetical protein
MKTKTQKPISMKIAAYTTLHVNKDFVTNGHFAVRSSLFNVLNLKKSPPTSVMQAYGVNGAGSVGNASSSYLTTEKVERVFSYAYDEEYCNEIPSSRSADEKIMALAGEKGRTFIALKYLPLFERLDKIPGGVWQINTAPEMKPARFVLNGKTVALLMPVKGPK